MGCIFIAPTPRRSGASPPPPLAPPPLPPPPPPPRALDSPGGAEARSSRSHRAPREGSRTPPLCASPRLTSRVPSSTHGPRLGSSLPPSPGTFLRAVDSLPIRSGHAKGLKNPRNRRATTFQNHPQKQAYIPPLHCTPFLWELHGLGSETPIQPRVPALSARQVPSVL